MPWKSGKNTYKYIIDIAPFAPLGLSWRAVTSNFTGERLHVERTDAKTLIFSPYLI